jgi:class 3 adenylate cyclase
LHIRIGIHTGEVIHDAGDLFGRHVNLAARVSAQGGPDEIVASQLVVELVSAMGDIEVAEPREVALKGFEGVHRVYPVVWRTG